jgi:hypothetical protein|tara:strand:+ start:22714 stop:23208 length:495 start_codon:yes stop_codon:yes gene_type:complete
MQTLKQLEEWYDREDPWGYKVHPDDTYRKNFYLAVLEDVGPMFSRALDLGAGEGWITKDLPAVERHALELSDIAASRLPEGVDRVESVDTDYDLVLATGVLYAQYDHVGMDSLIRSASSESHGTIVFVAGIKDWLKPYNYGRLITEYELLYREYDHVIKVWEYR